MGVWIFGGYCVLYEVVLLSLGVVRGEVVEDLCEWSGVSFYVST